LRARLCIGDGYIFVLKSALHAALFASYLAQLIEAMVAARKAPVEFHFRIGVHVGLTYRFWDWGRGNDGGWNYIGDGITGGQRVLSAIGKDTDDVVFVSYDVRNRILSEAEDKVRRELILSHLQNRGRRADKHGTLRRVYEVNHTGVADSMLAPSVSE
jgi:hypothetical protein